MEKEDVLYSWKEISNYLDRDIRTCLRWESELELPVYRIDIKSPRSKVFAYKSEIDQWLKKRANLNGIKRLSFFDNRRVVIGLISFLTLISVTFAILFFSQFVLKPSPPQIITIAVFPFERSNSSEFDEYFFEGITDNIIKKLDLLTRLKVIHINSRSSQTAPPLDLSLISKELDTDYFLKGYIEKNNDRVKMRIKLINTKNNEEIWDTEYDNKLEDVFYILEDLCERIIKSLKLSADQKILYSFNNGETRNYQAYDNYLKGNYILNHLNNPILNSSGENDNDPWTLYIEGKAHMDRFTQESNYKAMMHFTKAIENDSNFALAYVGLANCYSNNINFEWDVHIKWLNQAEVMLKEVQSISPGLPEYYTTSIQINLLKEYGFNEDTKKITRDLIEEGIKKHPYNVQLISKIGSYHFLKFGEEGNEADFEKALERKRTIYLYYPFRITNFNYAELLMLKKDFSDAVYVCENIEKYNPSYLVKSRRGEIYYYAGDLEISKAIFKELENIDLNFKIDSMLFLAMIAAQSGEEKKALGLIEQINLLSPQKKILGYELRLSSIYLGLGMKESGYDYLRSFFDRLTTKKMHYTFLKYIDIDKNFNNVRNEEEFKNIINIKR